MLQPLQPPSRLEVAGFSVMLDYQQRSKPGFVWLEAKATLSNHESRSVDEQFMVVSDDVGSLVSWRGQELHQEHLVLQLPDASTATMTQASIFRLILLPGETGQLRFEGWQRLAFENGQQHRTNIRFPLSRAWKNVAENQVLMCLTPELQLLNQDLLAVPGMAGRYKGVFSRYTRLVDLQVVARVDKVSWTGVLGAIPALRHSWLWGGVAALLAVTCVVVVRLRWWLTVPLALLFYLFLRQGDKTVNGWTYYQDAAAYRQMLDMEWYLVAFWAGLGAVGVRVLSKTEETR